MAATRGRSDHRCALNIARQADVAAEFQSIQQPLDTVLSTSQVHIGAESVLMEVEQQQKGRANEDEFFDDCKYNF